MRGIPFQASQGDVIKFFAPLLPRHIELIEEVGGRPSGQAYAYFNCHEDAELAMEKDKDYMGGLLCRARYYHAASVCARSRRRWGCRFEMSVMRANHEIIH